MVLHHAYGRWYLADYQTFPLFQPLPDATGVTILEYINYTALRLTVGVCVDGTTLFWNRADEKNY